VKRKVHLDANSMPFFVQDSAVASADTSGLPTFKDVVVELLAPEQAGVCLAGNAALLLLPGRYHLETRRTMTRHVLTNTSISRMQWNKMQTQLIILICLKYE